MQHFLQTPPPRTRRARRRSVRCIGVLAAAVLCAACARDRAETDADLLELDAPALAMELAAGRVSAERVTRAALARIAALDDAGPMLNAIIEVNPEAVEIARSLDARFAERGPVGPLHGVPDVLKANIDTGDRLATSAGSLALADHRAAVDAELVARVRAAGAVILAKTNLSEWANFRSLRSTSGWSSLGGQTRNAYVLDRNPCGSSSGSAVAVAAGLVPLAVGTETDGSIVCPAGANGVVGIKPTLGLVSQGGIIPIAASQDAAGPIARTVAGAALLLAAMQTTARESVPRAYATGRADLRAIRIGVVRDYMGAGEDADVEAAFGRWLELLTQAGAILVDPLAIDMPEGARGAELEVLLHEFKAGIDQYLAAAHVEPGSLEALIAFNAAHAREVMPHFGQDVFEMAQARGGLEDPAYREAVAASQTALRARLEALFAAHDLDALVAPVNAPAWKTDWVNGDRFSLSSSSIAAVSGYPSVAVPGGLVHELPVGIAFIGEPWSEALLIEIAAVFERLRGALPAPRFVATLEP
jgi:amidase